MGAGGSTCEENAGLGEGGAEGVEAGGGDAGIADIEMAEGGQSRQPGQAVVGDFGAVEIEGFE